jgi:hypothetical protein
MSAPNRTRTRRPPAPELTLEQKLEQAEREQIGHDLLSRDILFDLGDLYPRLLRIRPMTMDTVVNLTVEVFAECMNIAADFAARGICCGFDPYPFILAAFDGTDPDDSGTLVNFDGLADNFDYAACAAIALEKRYIDVPYGDDHMLMTAVDDKNITIATRLLEAGASTEICCSQGWTPLRHAVERLDGEMISLLLRYGANPLAADANGNTPRSLVRQMSALLGE